MPKRINNSKSVKRWIAFLPFLLGMGPSPWMNGQSGTSPKSFPAEQFVAMAHPDKKVHTSQSDSSFAESRNRGAVRLSGNVNSSASELAPFRYADKIYFSSNKDEVRDASHHRRLYTAVGDNPAFLFEGNPREKSISVLDATLTPDARRVYLSICEEREGQHCEIWYREKDYEGKWGAIKKLPRHINLSGYHVRQPATGYSSTMKKELLFFSSDRPGGKGGFDIWYCTVEPGGNFSEPLNLPFNAEKDEVTPFYYGNEQILYFSSDSGEGSIGGFDIFRADIVKKDSWSAAENLGLLFNSAADEIYFTYHGSSRTAYFASNRDAEVAGKPEDEKSNFDIYQVKPLVRIDISVYDSKNKKPVDGTMAELTDISAGMPVLLSLSPLDAEPEFNLHAGVYLLEIRKQGYQPACQLIDIRELGDAQARKIEFFLTELAEEVRD
ncbi:MAG: hypothetical protein RI973_109 [Bacteroidota bacterium]|jgi:hypothetical protein